jgi:hypothetical protein
MREKYSNNSTRITRSYNLAFEKPSRSIVNVRTRLSARFSGYMYHYNHCDGKKKVKE